MKAPIFYLDPLAVEHKDIWSLFSGSEFLLLYLKLKVDRVAASVSAADRGSFHHEWTQRRACGTFCRLFGSGHCSCATPPIRKAL